MRILPAFVKFLDFFLQVLHEDGVVRCEGDRVEVLRGPEQVELLDSAAANAELPGFEPTISFIEHCVRNFPAALSGDVDAVGVLFPDGDSTRLEQAFRTLLDASNYRVYAELTGRLLAELADAVPGRPLRVLEVGGGNGQLTRIVAAALRGREVEYCFTDLGGSFVRRARGGPPGAVSPPWTARSSTSPVTRSSRASRRTPSTPSSASTWSTRRRGSRTRSRTCAA